MGSSVLTTSDGDLILLSDNFDICKNHTCPFPISTRALDFINLTIFHFIISQQASNINQKSY